MSPWHPTLAAQVGLRLTGCALLSCLRPELAWLQRLMAASPIVTPAQWALAAGCFLSASIGAALLWVGPDLWKPVRLPN